MPDKKISELPIAAAISAADVSVLVDKGTDYQYSFTLLLQFLQANLAPGARISFGTTLPQNTTGANGDVFVNTAAGSFAQKTAGTWVVVYTLPASNGADGTLLYGAGLPASATGKNADSYINTLTGVFYLKSSGAWAQVFSMATGPQGPQGIAGVNGTNGTNGNTILFGNGNPSNSTTGNNGDFYINTSNYTLFGPKADGTWTTGTSIIGSDGAGGPQGPAGVAGPAGATGLTGAAGPPGATGATGPAGATGATGLTGAQGPAGATGAAGSSFNYVASQIPSGTLNGINVTFTAAHTPLSGSLSAFYNGLLLIPTTHYTVSGATIILATAPISTDNIMVTYQY